jgi:hypothetical protein
MAQLCTSVMPDDRGRREFMKVGTAYFIAARWGGKPASDLEKRMTDSKKPNTLPF